MIFYRFLFSEDWKGEFFYRDVFSSLYGTYGDLSGDPLCEDL